jgi:hypothetical protein
VDGLPEALRHAPPPTRSTDKGATLVPLILLLVILALVFGGIGLLVEGLFWLLIISVILFVAGGVLGTRGRRAPR